MALIIGWEILLISVSLRVSLLLDRFFIALSSVDLSRPVFVFRKASYSYENNTFFVMKE